MAIQIIPIDCGRNAVKLLENKSFKSVVGEWHHREISDGEEYEVIINGNEKYFVGQLATDESIAPIEMNIASKIHNQTRVLFLTGVALSILDTEADLVICTGVPVDQFNSTTKNALENLLYGVYDIRVNDVHIKKLNISNITIIPEGVAAFQYALSKDETLSIGKKRILDVGSLTVNFSTLNGSKFVTRDSGTIPFGTIKLKGNHIDNEMYVSKIISELSQKFTDYDPSDKVLLTGGGALQFKDLFKKYYPNLSIIDNPVFANVEGYFRMGMKKWANQMAKSQAE